ncbi:MAG: sigma-70 family RNA polymerase sigma factor [Rikenellaceae bacterium]
MNVQTSISDNVLLSNYLQGDNGAISQLIERHSKRVKSYIRMLVKDPQMSDDLLQDTFIKAVKMIDAGRYTESGKFLSWILRIAHNLVIDHFRQLKNSKVLNEAEAGYDVIGTLKIAESSLEDKIVTEQIHADLHQLVDLLPQEQAEVVKLRYFSGLSFKDIAEQTDVSINTALGRMRYALINLRTMIKEKNISLTN